MTKRIPQLQPGVVYIWEGRLDVPDRITAAARRLLSARERKRADRFVYDRHRRRYTVAQAHLRRVLGQLTGIPPETVRFHYEDKGKPFLPGGPSFNQSHSEDRLMIAVAGSGRLGVDIEERRTVRLMLGIAEKNFARDEAARLHAAPADERRRLFFRIWTRKEAFLKALGFGLAIPGRDPEQDQQSAAAAGGRGKEDRRAHALPIWNRGQSRFPPALRRSNTGAGRLGQFAAPRKGGSKPGAHCCRIAVFPSVPEGLVS